MFHKHVPGPNSKPPKMDIPASALTRQKLRTRYDVTQMVYVAFIHHLLVGICILTNMDDEYSANRAKMASARNILLFTLEKLMMP